jgi:hypothetical protein
MGTFEVTQRTKDGMFNATALLKQWNEANNTKKELKDFFENKSTKDYIEVLENEENKDGGNSPYVKSRASRGLNAGTWMHPYLFIDFAMWINPKFKYQVIKFVYDQLIKYRNDAGDAYKELGKAVGTVVQKSFMPVAMSQVARAMNYIVYGDHETEIRNKRATEERSRELFDLERKITMLIADGYITSYEHILKQLRLDWKRKHFPKVLMPKS